MTQHSAPVGIHVPTVDAYYRETLQLVAGRIPPVILLVLVASTAVSGLDWLYHPERAALLLLGFAMLVLISTMQIVVVHRHPTFSVSLTQGLLTYLAVSLGIYCGAVRGRTELLVVDLVLLMIGAAVLFPWGARGQLWGSLGALTGYPLALALGAIPTLPVPYELLAVVTAAGVAVVGAAVVDRHRFSTFQHQAFSAALLLVARSLNAAASDPHTLAERLTEYARQALGADWAVLYQRDSDDAVFRTTALVRVPAVVIEQVRAVEFSPSNAPALYRQLEQSETVELMAGSGVPDWLTAILDRSNVSVVILQAIKREDEMIGVLACGYAAPREPLSPAERQLIAALASHAVVALENARLVDEARRANRLKSELVAAITHELRTPLTAITGFTDLLLAPHIALPQDRQRDLLERIRQQSVQLQDLIGTILDLNRLDVQRLPLAINLFTIAQVIDNVRNGIPPGWCKEGVAMQWQTEEAETVIETDRAKLETILRNLVHNALKYTDAGDVTIASAVRRNENRVVFTVTDTGPGIAEEDQSTIFEMFHQGSKEPSRGGGVGLGLHIVKRLTEALGGEVHLESREGRGARFEISLPIAARHAAMA